MFLATVFILYSKQQQKTTVFLNIFRKKIPQLRGIPNKERLNNIALFVRETMRCIAEQN
jgi:hypothetical protein